MPRRRSPRISCEIFTFGVRHLSNQPADNRNVNVRLVTRAAAAGALFALSGFFASPAQAVTQGPSCGEQLFTNPQGLQIRVLWAKNGAVQRYIVVKSDGNTEGINDMRLDLQRQLGPEGDNAPPLRIVSFKPGTGGMMIPDKAIDSCGRTLSFQ
jgi:hypothetical protein